MTANIEARQAPAPVSTHVRSPLEVLRSYEDHDGTLWGLLCSRAEKRGAAPFLIFDGSELSWLEARAQVDRTRSLLGSCGVVPGDRVGVMAANSADYVILFFATAAVGAIFVPINPELTASETAYIVGHAQPTLIFVSPGAADTLAAACADLNSSALVRVLDKPLTTLVAEDNASPPSGAPRSSSQDTALILYTSGTTGFPKGVMHSQRSIILAGEYFVERMRLQAEDRMLCVLPFFHINGLFYSLMGAAAAGAALIIASRFSARNFWSLAAKSRATEVNIIAAVGRILMRRPREEFVPGHAIRKLYGAPITADIHEVFSEQFGIPDLIEGYGLTEVPGISANPFEGRRKLGSIGVPTPHPDPDFPRAVMRIVDEQGQEVPTGTEGELIVSSPMMMQGYYQDAEATRAVLKDGWFRTGDLVKQESDGYFTFVARQKDVIRRRGENISGGELDQVVGRHPQVQNVAAIAVDAELGEDDILLAVVPQANSRLTEQEIRRWCEQHLSRAKWPRYVVLVDALPYTPSHRVAKFQLRRDPALRSRAVEFPDLPSSRQKRP